MKKLPQSKQIFLFHLSPFRGAYQRALVFLFSRFLSLKSYFSEIVAAAFFW
ncbi:hypothetical protein CHCC14821_4155 [Bacillus paralicheniformis]|nr:hypothetical protein CHCC14821_4155 [Bacillus paralicheniformis]